MFKWSIVLLLPLTLGWKLAVRPSNSSELKQKEPHLEVAEFLRRQHFSVAVSDKIEEGQPAIRATSNTCRILVAKSPATGWDRDQIRKYATATDRVFVVFRGQIYPEQPTLLTVATPCERGFGANWE